MADTSPNVSARPVTHALIRPRRRLSTLRSEAGFSLIELLVVMLVLGILLSIGLVAFAGQDKRASDAGSKAVARDVSHAMEQCYLEVRNYQTCASSGTGSKLLQMGLVQPTVQFGTAINQVSFPATSGNVDDYIVQVQSPTGALWKITRTGGGLPVRTCAAASGVTLPVGDCRSANMAW